LTRKYIIIGIFTVIGLFFIINHKTIAKTKTPFQNFILEVFNIKEKTNKFGEIIYLLLGCFMLIASIAALFGAN
jgi:hypothetical protein